MNDQFLVLTPEKVVISYRIAGFGTRVTAHVMDLVLSIGLSTGIVTGSLFLLSALGTMAAQAIASLLGALAFLLYFVLFEWLNRGATPGKKAAKIQVVMADGTPVTFMAALYRNFLRIADFLPLMYLLGFLCMLMNERSQRLGDMVSGTMVVAERSPKLSFHPAPHHVGIHQYESTVGQLRKMSLDEYYALKRICDRAPWLPPQTLDWSIEAVWRPIAEKNDIASLTGVHPIYQMQAVVMKYGRLHKLL